MQLVVDLGFNSGSPAQKPGPSVTTEHSLRILHAQGDGEEKGFMVQCTASTRRNMSYQRLQKCKQERSRGRREQGEEEILREKLSLSSPKALAC